MKDLKQILEQKKSVVTAQLSNQRKWIQSGTTSIPNLLMMDNELSLPARMLFISLLMHGFGKKQCFPANYLLQHELGLSDRQIRRYKTELMDVGLVAVKRTGRSNVYEINHDVLEQRAEAILSRYNKCIVENAKNKDNE